MRKSDTTQVVDRLFNSTSIFTPVSNSGTSEGAKKGWEDRRAMHGGALPSGAMPRNGPAIAHYPMVDAAKNRFQEALGVHEAAAAEQRKIAASGVPSAAMAAETAKLHDQQAAIARAKLEQAPATDGPRQPGDTSRAIDVRIPGHNSPEANSIIDRALETAKKHNVPIAIVHDPIGSAEEGGYGYAPMGSYKVLHPYGKVLRTANPDGTLSGKAGMVNSRFHARMFNSGTSEGAIKGWAGRVRATIRDNHHPDTLGTDKQGNIVARRGFFYRHGKSSQDFADKISATLKEKGVEHGGIEHGEHNAPFRGSASTANSSHWWVKVKPPADSLDKAMANDPAYQAAKRGEQVKL